MTSSATTLRPRLNNVAADPRAPANGFVTASVWDSAARRPDFTPADSLCSIQPVYRVSANSISVRYVTFPGCRGHHATDRNGTGLGSLVRSASHRAGVGGVVVSRSGRPVCGAR